MMGGSVEVTRGGAEAVPELRAMIAAYGDGPVWPDSAWARFVGSAEEGALLLAREAGGPLLGWLAAGRVGEESELEFVLIDRAHRGQGLGARLVTEWIAWARANGVTELLLEVRAGNAAALALYGRFGFAEQGRRRGYYRDPVEDAVLMGRRVEEPDGDPKRG